MTRLTIIISALLIIANVPIVAQPLLSWSEQHDSPGGGHGIDCNSSGTCVASLSTVIRGDAYVLRSTDRGTTWDTTYKSPFDLHAGIKSASPGPVQFLNDSVVLVLLDSAYVLRSTNAGATWQRHSVSSYNSGRASQMKRASDSIVLCVVEYGRVDIFQGDSIFFSMDAGLSWAPTSIQPKLSTRSQAFPIQGLYTNEKGMFGTITYYSLDTSNTILLTETSDSGRSWSERTITTPTGSGAYGVSITYFDSNQAVLTAIVSLDSGLVMKTWDRGDTWSTLFFGQTRNTDGDLVRTGMLTSSFLDSTHGIAATRSGVIETNDGGVSWHALDSRVWIPKILHYIDSNHAVGITSYGTIMVGGRDQSTVQQTKNRNTRPYSLVAKPGESLHLSMRFFDYPGSFTIINLMGESISRGPISRSLFVNRTPVSVCI